MSVPAAGDGRGERSALVTGGAGFIGSHLVDRLVDEGFHVRVLDDLSRGQRANLAAVQDRIELIVGDIRDRALVASAVQGVDVVFHLAAVPSGVESVEDPAGTNSVNVDGTLAVLEGARAAGVRRVVFAASCAAYGDDPVLPKREDMQPRPASPYALQKVACEEYCRLYTDLYGLEAVALRFFNVFGPRQDPHSDYAAAVPRFALAAVRDETVHIYGDGEQTRDFVYVGDVARACLLAAECRGVGGELFNIAGGRGISVNELVRSIGDCVGRPVDVVHESERPGEVRHSEADLGRARERIGYQPEVDFMEGLRRTVQTFCTPPAVGARELEPDRETNLKMENVR